MQYEGHLALQEIELPASAEQLVKPAGWCFFRLSHGVGYCFADKKIKEVETGGVLVVPPGREMVFRASQLGPVKAHYVNFQPEFMGLFLTVAEKEEFAALAAAPNPAVAHLSAADKIAVQFAAICQKTGRESQFSGRCRILFMAALFFAPRLSSPQSAADQNPPPVTAKARFLELVRQTPEAELFLYSPAELARICRCPVTHFRRMLRAHFGMSFRSKQTRSRLERARQMLLETESDIDDVAVACGYRSRKVFSEMFKKQFGLSPADVRVRGNGSKAA